MSEPVIINEIFVGGILVEVHSHRDSANSNLPVHALFLLHGRTQSTNSVVHVAKSILEINYGPGTHRKRDLVIIAYATGTVHDLTFLIDHIPAYIYPQVERSIVEWGVAGISLGGHSTWIALTREPRIQLAIPIIGCPDYTKLISQRAQFHGISLEAPHYPLHLKAYVEAYDPASFAFREKDVANPFLGKRILVLSGAEDKLVPWTASQEFVEGLEVGGGVKKVVLEENVGHDCTPAMIQEAALFVRDWLAE
ncbi:Alpha/Beta hydrolase protein [Butyriboletus roseoflavus]|nr:Alpha/Beta hydrolase protein [Butyriboletus roseoflavus]